MGSGIDMRMNFRSTWLIIFAVRKAFDERVVGSFVEIVSRSGIGCSVDV
jgi:hypothetical protein